MLFLKNQRKLFLLFLGFILFATILLTNSRVFAQPACEWDGSGYCCGRTVPCNGGTYGPSGDECLGTIAPSPSMCAF